MDDIIAILLALDLLGGVVGFLINHSKGAVITALIIGGILLFFML